MPFIRHSLQQSGYVSQTFITSLRVLKWITLLKLYYKLHIMLPSFQQSSSTFHAGYTISVRQEKVDSATNVDDDNRKVSSRCQPRKSRAREETLVLLNIRQTLDELFCCRLVWNCEVCADVNSDLVISCYFHIEVI